MKGVGAPTILKQGILTVTGNDGSKGVIAFTRVVEQLFFLVKCMLWVSPWQPMENHLLMDILNISSSTMGFSPPSLG